MGNWTIVIHGTGPHENLEYTEFDGRQYIAGRANDYDADLLFLQFVNRLRQSHTISDATFTVGKTMTVSDILPEDYVNQYLPREDT